MRCVFCRRNIDKPTVWIKGMPIGPVCARRNGLLPTKQQFRAVLLGHVKRRTADSDTPDMFSLTMNLIATEPKPVTAGHQCDFFWGAA